MFLAGFFDNLEKSKKMMVDQIELFRKDALPREQLIELGMLVTVFFVMEKYVFVI